ncbi:MAG TPA: acyl-CoA dehydrogenase family protein [Paraburkholderia sp.]|jgi:alkylation response protein AidB-like acyl-CoA dehydrogenase|nr:acyl-CoA dehydrogenase family protein [Paraburkholderia sp.]
MLSHHDTGPINLGRLFWTLTEDQQRLSDAVERFVRERLAPLLTQPATPSHWDDTVRLSGELGLGTMILPAHRGGFAIDHHDLYLVIQQFAAGPLERAAELTLSTPALMTLREHDALDCLPAREIRDHFNGTTSISLAVPGDDASKVWVLCRHMDAPLLLPHESADSRSLALVAPHDLRRVVRQRRRIAALQGLGLEQITVGHDELASCPRIGCGPDSANSDATRTWLAETGFYLCALLVGAMQQSVAFAFEHAAARQTFRKPLATHQLVATRLADMLIAARGARLFLRAAAESGILAQDTLIRQLLRHVAAEAMDVSRELVQLCGGHGYVEGLPPAGRFRATHWFALLLSQTETALGQYVPSSPLPASHGVHPSRGAHP